METENYDYIIDGVTVQITVARLQGGQKVGEVPFNPVKLFHPFDLNTALDRALDQVRAQSERPNGA